jgi:signal transduction histidine kinase
MRVAGLALTGAVWVLGVVPPPPRGLSAEYLVTYTGLLAAMVALELTLPPRSVPARRRSAWLGAELVLSFLVVQTHGTLLRPALIYLLPTSRALLLFDEPLGLVLSGLAWVGYAANIWIGYAWPDHLGEFPNYLSFFLAPYVLAVVLTLSTLRQAADRARLQALYDQLREAHNRLAAMHGRVREAAVLEERGRLAREIHDGLAHYLTVINVQLEAAEKLATADPVRSLEHVGRARRLTLACLQDVRRSVGALRAATLEELSLPVSLRQLVSEFAASTGLQVELALPEQVRPAPEVGLALYRAAQEGLTNAQRHARAHSVCLSLRTRARDGLELIVEDDGIGPDAGAVSHGEGFGLLGLRERVELLGGRVSFDARPGGGSRLTVSLPAGEVGESATARG